MKDLASETGRQFAIQAHFISRPGEAEPLGRRVPTVGAPDFKMRYNSVSHKSLSTQPANIFVLAHKVD